MGSEMKFNFLCLLPLTTACISSRLDTTITTIDDGLEVLILTRYFVRDFESYGNALIQSAEQIIVDANALFRTDADGNSVNWWQGIEVQDIIDVKDYLIRYLYEVYRFVARSVDYIDDISNNACGISVINNALNATSVLGHNLLGDGYQEGDFSLSPCNFDRTAVMNEAAKVVNVVEWIEMQFDFVELFWTTYGFLFQQI